MDYKRIYMQFKSILKENRQLLGNKNRFYGIFLCRGEENYIAINELAGEIQDLKSGLNWLDWNLTLMS